MHQKQTAKFRYPCGLATSPSFGHKNVERRKDVLVHPIKENIQIFLFNMLYGEQKYLNVALIGWTRVTCLSFLPSSVYFSSFFLLSFL